MRLTIQIGDEKHRVPCGGEQTVASLQSLITSRYDSLHPDQPPLSISHLCTSTNVHLHPDDQLLEVCHQDEVLYVIRSSAAHFSSMGDARTGDMIGTSYYLLSNLGEGSFARLFVAHDLNLNRYVAVKVLKRAHNGRSTEVATRRFLREAEINAALSASPYVVTVYDAGRARSGVLYIVMELLRGMDCSKWLDDKIEQRRAMKDKMRERRERQQRRREQMGERRQQRPDEEHRDRGQSEGEGGGDDENEREQRRVRAMEEAEDRALPCISVRECVAIMRCVLQGLAAAHNHTPPVIHRDIKPDNIWLNQSFFHTFDHGEQHQQHLPPDVQQQQDQQHTNDSATTTTTMAAAPPHNDQQYAKLMDFGLAVHPHYPVTHPLSSKPRRKPPRSSSAFSASSSSSPALPALKSPFSGHPTLAAGTRMYASPEQTRKGALLETESDIWSVGVVMYQMMSMMIDVPFDPIQINREWRRERREEARHPHDEAEVRRDQADEQHADSEREVGQVGRGEEHESLSESRGEWGDVADIIAYSCVPLSVRMRSVIMKCLRREPSLRWRSVEEIIAQLDLVDRDENHKQQQQHTPHNVNTTTTAPSLPTSPSSPSPTSLTSKL